MKPIVILYHADCTDGICAAYAAWKKFRDAASYVSIANQSPPPKGLEDKEIYTVDFAFPLKITRQLLKTNKSLTSIDHHISNKKAVALTLNPMFNIRHSGAVLSWAYFHASKKIPLYLKYTEDADLWKLKMLYAREYIATRPLLPNSFPEIDEFINKFEKASFRKKLFNKGGMYLEHKNYIINDIIKNIEKVTLNNISALAVNSPVFIDELAEYMYKKEDLAIIWHEKKNTKKISLRSNGKVDVSKIAEYYGGGGHKKAAAFKLGKRAKLPWK